MSSARWTSSSRLSSALPKRRERLVGIVDRPKTAAITELEPPPSNLLSTEHTNGSSLIRPLSGKIFIRRTVKNGWMAKAVNDLGSFTDLEREDELLSDAESLDSFFDDDFEDDSRDQALGKLLSCNTLGVESKGRKPDWRAGGLAIPEFHCPRCRDHWYGLSAFPCDEELARLIREGKWHTGRGDSKHANRQNESNRERSNGEKEMDSTSTDSLSLPGIQRRKGSQFQTNKSERNGIDFMTPSTRNKKKNNRRITFKLDENEDNLVNAASNTSLDSEKLRSFRSRAKDGTNARILGSDTNGSRDDANKARKNTDSSSSASDVNSGSSATLLLQQGGDDQGNSAGGNTVTSDAQSFGRRRRSKENGGTSDDYNNFSSGHGNIEKGMISKDSQRGSNEMKSNREENDSSLPKLSHGMLPNGSQERNFGGTTDDDQSDPTGRHGTRAVASTDGIIGDAKDNSQIRKRAGGGDGSGKNGRHFDSLASSQRGSQTSLHGNSQRWGRGEKGDRELHRGKGYMRASSPSQSDWADPTHARIWASNTASSSRVSLAPSSHCRDNSEEEGRVSLPPIIRRKNGDPFGMLSFVDGFELTRPYTFSYH